MEYFSQIKTYENVLSLYEMEYVHKCLASDNWKFGQKSDPKSEKRFWYMELSNDEFFVKFFLDRIKIITGENFELSRVYANGQTFGLDGEWHTDAKKEDAYTFLYYSNTSWHNSWGGETVFSVDNNLIYVVPKPNKAILFPANIFHYGKSPSRDFYGLRTTVAFKLKLLK
jgi:hypothetical protein